MRFGPAELLANKLLMESSGPLVELYVELFQALDSITASVDRRSGKPLPALGLSIVLLRSLARDLRGVGLLLSCGYIGPAASVAASLWEKAVMMVYILKDPEARAGVYSQHELTRKLPWSCLDMAKDVAVDLDPVFGGTPELRTNSFYFMYFALCTIKHPNPQTVGNLAGTPKSGDLSPFLEPDLTRETTGIAGFILSIVDTVVMLALFRFARSYCSPEVGTSLAALGDRVQRLTSDYSEQMHALSIPPIVLGPDEFPREFLDFLRNFKG